MDAKFVRFCHAILKQSFALLVLCFLGCAKQNQSDLPDKLIDLLENASTNEEVFELSKVIPLRTNDSVFVGDIMHLSFGDSGMFAVTDRSNHTPFVFDQTGTFLGRIGKEGSGPGEFKHASAVAWNYKSRMWHVADNSRLRISTFDESYQYLGEFKMPGILRHMQTGPSGDLYLFMPNHREGSLVERVNAKGEKISGMLSSEIIAKLPFVIYGGGLCVTPHGVIAAHYLSSELTWFDLNGAPKLTVSMKELDHYVPHSNADQVQDLRTYVPTFTGIAGIHRCPFNLVLVEYNRAASTVGGKPDVYLALIGSDGRVFASGITSSVAFLASDLGGRLYSVGDPPSSSAQGENPVINQWTLKGF